MGSLAERMRNARERDRQFVMSLNLEFLDKVLLPLFVAFVCLDFLDIYSTLLAISQSFDFRELNPIASTLFSMRFEGFLIAVAFKYLPAIPLFYLVFVRDSKNKHPFEIRFVRFVALIVVVAADALLGFVVAVNNIPVLLSYVMR